MVKGEVERCGGADGVNERADIERVLAAHLVEGIAHRRIADFQFAAEQSHRADVDVGAFKGEHRVAALDDRGVLKAQGQGEAQAQVAQLNVHSRGFFN